MGKERLMTDEELIALTPGELIDMGVCPTCLNRRTGGKVYGDDSEKMIYADGDIEVFLAPNPRAKGHTIIASYPHYHDLAEAPDCINEKIIRFAKAMSNILRRVYGCERVYLCTMSDGPMNHYHVQLIPRYPDEPRGSKNFVKERQPYIHDPDKVNRLRELIKGTK